jgi:hypothetical protein
MERADRISAEADKPFDHEVRMKELPPRQAELNAALDPDKNETQVVPRGEQDSVRLKSSRLRQFRSEYSLLESSRIPMRP